jgi:hypothetical protein
MKYAYIDTETVSDLDIKSAGTVRYAEECEALCVTIIPPNSNDCILWEAHRGPMPRNMRDLLDDDSITWVAHNALFDRTVMVNALGCANLDDPSRWVCTAALCRYMGLPGKLAQACTRLAVPPHLCKFDDSGGINLFTKRYSKRFYTPDQMPEPPLRTSAHTGRTSSTTCSCGTSASTNGACAWTSTCCAQPRPSSSVCTQCWSSNSAT